MRARVRKDFFDIQAEKIRREGDVFECDKERFTALENNKHGALVERAPRKRSAE